VAVTFTSSASTIAQTVFDSTAGRFTKPTIRFNIPNEPYPQLAANLSGRSVFIWQTACCLHVASGSRARLGRGTRVPASREADLTEGFNANVQDGPSDQNIGIDGRGNAVITWDEFGSNYYRGLYVALHHSG
jgi:hypothetical protein